MQARPAISLRSYGDAVRHHRHAFHQFVLPLHGVLELDTPAGERPVGADTAVLIPAGMAHSFRARGDNRFAVVDVGGERPLPDHARDEPAFPVSAALRHQLTLLGSRARDGAAAPSLRHLWNALAFNLLAGDGRLGAGSTARRFSAAVECIRADTCLTVTGLAAAVGVTPARLHALFRHHAGTTPGDCILQARLERGAAALTETGRAITDIALDSGFSEHSAFTRAFRRVYGISPSAYRRRYCLHRH